MRVGRLLAATGLFAIALSPVFCQVLTPPSSRERDAQQEKDNVETGAYILTMDKIDRVYQMDHELVELGKSDPEKKDRLDKMNATTGSIEQIAAVRAAWPEMAAVIAKHGFTPHESVVVEIAVFENLMALNSIQQGADRAKLLDLMHLQAANVDFLKQHFAEIKALDAQYPTGGGSS